MSTDGRKQALAGHVMAEIRTLRRRQEELAQPGPDPALTPQGEPQEEPENSGQGIWSREEVREALLELVGDVSLLRVIRYITSQNQPLMSITEEPTMEEYLEQGPRLAGHAPVSLAVRGTPVADSIRCSWTTSRSSTSRTTPSRAPSLRSWPRWTGGGSFT